MVEIIGLVMGEDYILFGFIVKHKGNYSIMSKQTIFQKSKKCEIKNGYVRKEFIDGKEHIFVDLDEEITANVLSTDEAIKKYGPMM